MDGSSISDPEDELPVFDFLQPGRTQGPMAARADPRPADVMTISSDSDDDEAPYVPLAQRLQQRQQSGTRAPFAVVNGNQAEQRVPCQDVFPQPEPLPLGIPRDTWRPGKRTAEEAAVQVPSGKRAPDKEGLKLESQRRKAEKKSLAEAAKALRPEECIKHMVAVVDPALLQLEGGGTLLAALQALGCSCAIEKQTLPRSVSWIRRAPSAQAPDGECVPEAQVVMQMTVDNFIALIRGYIQEERLGGATHGATLTSWVQGQQRRHPGKTLSLAVIDMEKYFRSQKSQSQKRLREAVTGQEQGRGKGQRRKGGGEEGLPEVSRVDMEEALVHLQLHTGVAVRFLSTWKDFSDYITMTTKAIAEAPFKRERESTGFSFYLGSEWAGGQRVDKAGNGLLQVWKRQIQQLNRVSPDMASAILDAYPSPQLLAKAYSLCKTDKEKSSLLAELLIRRGAGVTSTTRRVGPELSKRLFLLFNSGDAEQTLDSGV